MAMGVVRLSRQMSESLGELYLREKQRLPSREDVALQNTHEC